MKVVRGGMAAAVLLVITSACTSNFAKDNPQLCSEAKIQAVKDAVAKNGLTPQQAADKVGTDARCLSDDETKQAQATYAAFKAQQAAATVPPTPTAAPTTAAPSASAAPSPSASASPSPSPSASPTPAPATTAPTEAPAATQPPVTATATPEPTATPTPAPTPTPTPAVAAGDAGWPPKAIGPIQSNEGPISGRIVYANGTGAGHYCIILTSGPCAVTSDANGNFTAKFAATFGSVSINLVIKGQYNPATNDGPVVATQTITMTPTGVTGLTITVP